MNQQRELSQNWHYMEAIIDNWHKDINGHMVEGTLIDERTLIKFLSKGSELGFYKLSKNSLRSWPEAKKMLCSVWSIFCRKFDEIVSAVLPGLNSKSRMFLRPYFQVSQSQKDMQNRDQINGSVFGDDPKLMHDFESSDLNQLSQSAYTDELMDPLIDEYSHQDEAPDPIANSTDCIQPLDQDQLLLEIDDTSTCFNETDVHILSTLLGLDPDGLSDPE